jgi:hypothetical protein
MIAIGDRVRFDDYWTTGFMRKGFGKVVNIHQTYYLVKYNETLVKIAKECCVKHLP